MRKINNEALQEILTIPQDEFIKKYNISYRTYMRWKNKVLQNNNQNQNNDIQNNQSQNNDEMEKGKIEQIPSLENKAILDLDGDNENNNQVANNSPDLVKSFCEVVYKGGLKLVEIFFKKRYKGNIDEFIKKVIPFWQRQLNKWNINLANMDSIMLIAMHLEIVFNLEDIKEEKQEITKGEIKQEHIQDEISQNHEAISNYNLEDIFKVYPVQ